MLKKPDNKIIMLTFMFLVGIVLIFIPLIQQHQEIEEDNNIYTMLMEEIQRQQAPVPTDISAAENESEDDPVTADLPDETPEANVPDNDSIPADVSLEESVIEEPVESDLPAMIIEAITKPEEAEEHEAPDTETIETESVINTVRPAKTDAPVPTAPTERPTETPTKAPSVESADYIATITIPGTVINYPVVRSDRTDYYLHHLITGQQSKLGTLFSLTTSDYETPSKNIAIYGHHLSNSTAMFSTLLQYKNESYWRNHQFIYLNTIYGKRTYRIFAVLNHTVSEWDASTASFKNDEAFLKFVNRAQRKSFYDTGITVSEEDHIITLITCDRSYGGVQGRLLVMGVEQREE